MQVLLVQGRRQCLTACGFVIRGVAFVVESRTECVGTTLVCLGGLEMFRVDVCVAANEERFAT